MVTKLVKVELLPINIYSKTTGRRVQSVLLDVATTQLTSPACTEFRERVSLLCLIEKHWPTSLPPIPMEHQSRANSTIVCLALSRTS